MTPCSADNRCVMACSIFLGLLMSEPRHSHQPRPKWICPTVPGFTGTPWLRTGSPSPCTLAPNYQHDSRLDEPPRRTTSRKDAPAFRPGRSPVTPLWLPSRLPGSPGILAGQAFKLQIQSILNVLPLSSRFQSINPPLPPSRSQLIPSFPNEGDR